MLRTIRAFLWMRWRVSRNAFKSRQRDSLEQISRALGALAPFFMLLLLIPTLTLLGLGGLVLGFKMGQADSVLIFKSFAYVGIRIGLAVATVTVLIAPMVRSSRGTGSETTRLMLLPIRRGILHASEVIGALSDPWLAILFPAVILFPIGLMIGGSFVGGAISFAGALLFIAIMMLIVSMASFTIALIFRKRKRAERFTAVLIVALSMSGLLFGFIGERWEDRIEAKKEAERFEIEAAAEENPNLLFSEAFDRKIPAASRLIPSEAFMRMVDASVDGRNAEVGLNAIVLVFWAGLLYTSSRWAYARLLDTPESGGSTGSTGSGLRMRTIPGVDPSVAAVAYATMRLALRTVRGKTAVYLNFPITAMIYILLVRNQSDLELPAGLSFGMGIGLLGGMFTVISLQPILVNIFAIDSNGFTLQLLSPLSTRDLLVGKVIGGAMLVGISTLLCFAVGFALAPGGSPLVWLAAGLALVSVYLLFAPFGLALSAVLPKHADLSRMGKDGNPQPIAAFAAFLAAPLLIAPPALLIAGAVLVAQSAWLALLASLIWLGIGVVIYVLSMRGLARLFERRRENLLLVATGR